MNAVRPTRRSWNSISLAFAAWLLPFAALAQGQPAESTLAPPVPDTTVVTVADAATTPAPPTMPSGPFVMSDLNALRKQLRRGDRISLVRTDGSALHGKIVRVGEVDLDLRTDVRQPGDKKRRVTLTVPLGAIESLERRRDSTANGALIGAGVGAGFGLAMFARAYAIDANEMDEWGGGYAAGTLVTTGLGALIGWAIDAAVSKPDIHYVRPRSSLTHLELVPIGAGGKGLSVVMAF